MSNIHVHVCRHVKIRKRIHDVGWVVEKQTRRVCGAVSPDLSLQVHSRVFDLAVKNLHAFFSVNRQKGRSLFCQLDWLVKWNSLLTHGPPPRSALPLSVNSNSYGTKVATHIKLPLSRSVLLESLPFEVTTLEGGKGGVRKREWEVCNRGGENEGINVWSFEASTLEKGLPQVFIPAAPVRAWEFIITNIWSMNARLTWREEFFTSTHLLWSQAPRWGDLRLASQWVHSPIYSIPGAHL